MTPLPGDFACVSMGGAGGMLVGLGERLNGDAFSEYQHAFIYVGEFKPGQFGATYVKGPQIVQAEPGGAQVAPLKGYGKILWSSGKIPLTAAQRDAIVAAAIGYEGTPYSWLDYVAIALHGLKVPMPGLRTYIKSTKHMICSQLVAQCYLDAGVDLFPDEWDGYVTPADLAARLEQP